jgi:cell wall-associated NlpC family hydrolase
MEIQAPGASKLIRLGLLVALICVGLLTTACGREDAEDRKRDRTSDPEEIVLTPEAAREGRKHQREQPKAPNSKAQVVELLGAGSAESIEVDPNDDAPSPGAPTDAEVRAELREARASLANFKKHLNTTAFLQTGPRARVLSDGTAVAPENAPDVVKRVIMAANEIAKFPYKWGGGHGAWRDDGYDCSGSVSFALAGAGLLQSPLTSGGFLNYGAPGRGRWITIYTNPGHVFMVVGGLRFDTSGQGRAGTRWQAEPRSTAGLVARRIPGL